MWPRIGPIPTYGILYLSGIVCHFLVSCLIARRLGLRCRIWILVSLCYLIGMTIGAKVLYDVHHGQFSLSALVPAESSSRGGLWGGMLAYILLATPLVLILARRKLAGLDLIVLSIPLPWVLTKLACLFNGCCYGQPCSMPWAITFPLGTRGDPAQMPLHPTQIYELLLLVCIAVVLRLLRHDRWRGAMMWWFLVLYGLGRAAIDMFRGDVDRFVYIGPLNLTQIICLSAACVSILMLFAWLRWGHDASVPEP